jgi:hypothetical protein
MTILRFAARGRRFSPDHHVAAGVVVLFDWTRGKLVEIRDVGHACHALIRTHPAACTDLGGTAGARP